MLKRRFCLGFQFNYSYSQPGWRATFWGFSVSQQISKPFSGLAAIFVAVLLTAGQARAVSIGLASFHSRTNSTVDIPVGATSDVEHRTGEMVCNLSLFFSVDPEVRLDHQGGLTTLDGRGLMSCKNDQGFTTELPVMADLEADLPKIPSRGPASFTPDTGTADKSPNEISFSGNSDRFVIPREVNQIYDVYDVRNFSWDRHESKTEPSVLFRGSRNDLVVSLKLNSKTSNLQGLKVKSMRLSFDDKAPEIF